MPSSRSRSARFPASRRSRSAASRSRRSGSRSIPAKLRGQGLVAGGRAQPDRDHHRRQPEGQYRRRDARLHDLRQRPVARLPRTGTTSSSPSATAARCASATSASAVTGPEDAKQAAWANGKRGVFLVVFKQPGANVIDTVDKIKATLPRLVAADPAGDQDRGHQRPHPDHPRRGRRTCSSPCS